MSGDSTDLGELGVAAQRARELADELAKLGGVVTVADLEARWGITYSTAHDYVRRDGFPAPWQSIGTRGQLWLAAEVDLWRNTPRPTGRPRAGS